jgi:hypothetical protein
MRWVAPVLALAAVAACGARETADVALPTTAQTQAAACDYCPGAPSTRIDVLSDSTFELCDCGNGPSPSGGMYFRIDPPLESCAHAQCMYKYMVAHDCSFNLAKDADGGDILPDCPPP